MYDVGDVLNASYCSADVANHVLRVYGEGSMGKGIRKLAGEMLIIGGQRSYNKGYEAGVSEAYSKVLKTAGIAGSIIGVCAICLIGLSAWRAKKTIEGQINQKKAPHLLTETVEAGGIESDKKTTSRVFKE